MKWPNERKPQELISFYGDPVLHSSIDPTWERDNIVELIPPYAMRYSWGPPAPKLRFHKKCRDAFGEALLSIKKLYGAQKDIEAHRLHLTGGSLMVRLKRGSSKSWSTHSFGAALDIDPQHNPFRSKWRPGFIPLEAAKCFQDAGLIWRGANGDTDPMHFQAVSRG
ncbi:M15 family metallopeptidase [Methylocystis parvus]|uniref:M15 family metallopeptidase n=1 Tax=Methylocystis parvus TaxID=134 RepID=A0A6B8M4R9_9HYPH|nr:M15 family metallopeptidase [Methylocystis parvus]QGM96333.1 M15 family metallopeptidase [Methylocystis parvus]WBJ99829.1 M15 family metallopeptidase [Methylocystis parvus OBBP]